MKKIFCKTTRSDINTRTIFILMYIFYSKASAFVARLQFQRYFSFIYVYIDTIKLEKYTEYTYIPILYYKIKK